MNLRDHMASRLSAALQKIAKADRPGIYAVSLLVYDAEDDPRRPSITVGYNTEAQVSACTPGGKSRGGNPEASSGDEARWNYALWLQNELDVICDETRDPQGAKLVQGWARQRGYWYTDDEEDEDFEAALERVAPLTAEFVGMLVEVVRTLHKDGVVAQIFGRPIPLLIHELEYYEEIARQNEAANPAATVASFARWIRRL